jgi:hypothetical protein
MPMCGVVVCERVRGCRSWAKNFRPGPFLGNGRIFDEAERPRRGPGERPRRGQEPKTQEIDFCQHVRRLWSFSAAAYPPHGVNGADGRAVARQTMRRWECCLSISLDSARLHLSFWLGLDIRSLYRVQRSRGASREQPEGHTSTITHLAMGETLARHHYFAMPPIARRATDARGHPMHPRP